LAGGIAAFAPGRWVLISLGAAALGLLVILDTSEELIAAREFGCIVRSLSLDPPRDIRRVRADL